MKKRFFSVLVLIAILISTVSIYSCAAKKEKFSSYSFDYFDTVTTITGYEAKKEDFDAISAELMALLEEYHKLFNIYNIYDGVNNLCTVNSLSNGNHSTVKVDQKIIDLLLFSKEMHQKTDGRVNIAMGSVLSIWHDYRSRGINDPSSAQLPPAAQLNEAAKHTDINDVIINTEKKTVFLADPSLLLDVGAIAKGYAVEMAAQMLIEKGITGYVINVGGNVRAVGTRDGGDPWLAGIENPDGGDDEPYFATLTVTDRSLVTSGSYQRYYIVDGKNYNHIIDPDSLFPADKYISVSVVCESSALADALSTSLFCMSVEEGKKLIADIGDVEAMWVHANGEIVYSSGFANYISD